MSNTRFMAWPIPYHRRPRKAQGTRGRRPRALRNLVAGRASALVIPPGLLISESVIANGTAMFSPLNIVNGVSILLILVTLIAVWASGLDAGPTSLDIGFVLPRG